MLIPSEFTIGPWDVRHQHGGPPSALLAGALERYPGADDFFLTRVTLELLKPVPLTPLRVDVEPIKMGRAVQRLRAHVQAEEQIVMEATAVRIARGAGPVTEPLPLEPWPEPQACPLHEFTFFETEPAYHRAVEVRIAHGIWGKTPIGTWARSTMPLIEGETTSSVEGLFIMADAQSGMGVPVDPHRASYLNPDLTVYLQRQPEPHQGWFGFDIRSYAGPQGSGVAQSAIRDARGEVARSAQSLLVRPRT